MLKYLKYKKYWRGGSNRLLKLILRILIKSAKISKWLAINI